MATCIFHLDLQSISYVSLFISAFTIFGSFLGPELMSASIASRMLQLLGYQLYLSTWGSYKLGGDSAVCTIKVMVLPIVIV